MRNVFCGGMIAVLLCLTAQASAAVTGRLIDNAQTAISDAQIHFKRASGATTSKADGSFSLDTLYTTANLDANRIQFQYSLRSGGVCQLQLPSAGRVYLLATDPAGRILSRLSTDVNAGTYTLQLPGLEQHSGPVLLRASFTSHSGIPAAAKPGVAGIDTILISHAGYTTLAVPVSSYDEDLGTIVLSTSRLADNDYYRIAFFDSSTTLPHQVSGSFFARDGGYLGVTGLSGCVESGLCEILLDGTPTTSENQPTIESIGRPYTRYYALVLDVGTALSQSALDSVVTAAKEFVRSIPASARNISVFAFSEEIDTVLTTTSDTTAIFAALNGITRTGSSTDLYKAIATGLEYHDASEPNKAVVVFTDGPDTKGSTSKDYLVDNYPDRDVWIAAGTWNSFALTDLRQVANGNVYAATKLTDIRTSFRSIAGAQRDLDASSYRVTAQSPYRGSANHSLAVRIIGNTNIGSDASDSIHYNSTGFVDGVAPTISDARIVVDGDSLRVRYTYSDADGDVEGSSQYHWETATTWDSWSNLSNNAVVGLDTSTNISYRVTITPCQAKGTPTCGTSTTVAIHFWRPTASSVLLYPTILVGDTIFVRYEFEDQNGDSEGTTRIQWFRDGVPLDGATGYYLAVTSADLGHWFQFSVTPVAASGYLPIGVTQYSDPARVYATGFAETIYGHRYPTITVGAQTWMAQNLRTVSALYCDIGCYRWGSKFTWSQATLRTSTSNYIENNLQGPCPANWHISTTTEWNALLSALRSAESLPTYPDSVGYYLASSTWIPDAPDPFAFNAVPAGPGTSNGSEAQWWTASLSGQSGIAIRIVPANSPAILTVNRSITNTDGIPLRCVHNY